MRETNFRTSILSVFQGNSQIIPASELRSRWTSKRYGDHKGCSLPSKVKREAQGLVLGRAPSAVPFSRGNFSPKLPLGTLAVNPESTQPKQAASDWSMGGGSKTLGELLPTPLGHPCAHWASLTLSIFCYDRLLQPSPG